MSLHAHPDFTKHSRGYSTAELSTLSERGESAYDDPLTITQDGTVIAGYALWQLAKLQKRLSIRCVVREMSQEQALIYIIEQNYGSRGINDFVRILLALELEPWFKERAKHNQRVGGERKGSSRLANADRLDVRVEIARAANVSTGNVSKVKYILRSAVAELYEALRLGNISISLGEKWARSSPASQRCRLSEDLKRRGIQKTISILLKKHESSHPQMCDGLRDLQHGLRKLRQDECLSSLLEPLSDIVRMVDVLLLPVEAIDRAA